MVPHNVPPPPEPARELSPETVRVLREVIADQWRTPSDGDGRLGSAVRAAAAEAKDRGLRPEELIIALKAVESEVFDRRGGVRVADADAERRFHEWLVVTCLRAFFAPEA
ncbi:MAG TPA: hypothetical protein VM076_20955 [Gemmatimonadaceae bacterium]|nr:hypothetical protein [Gemmatimonadaceae bacterium]